MFDTRVYSCDTESISLSPSCVYALRNELQRTFEAEWLAEVQRPGAKRGDGLNKLRTYTRFKSEFQMEPYLLHVQHEGKRLLLFKFRSGIAPIRIETGRYESNVDLLTGQGKKGVPEECRICPCCFRSVESEFHFLLECPRYKCLRHRLLTMFKSYCNNSDKPFPEDTN